MPEGSFVDLNRFTPNWYQPKWKNQALYVDILLVNYKPEGKLDDGIPPIFSTPKM